MGAVEAVHAVVSHYLMDHMKARFAAVSAKDLDLN
jgi:hypothetical protein